MLETLSDGLKFAMMIAWVPALIIGMLALLGLRIFNAVSRHSTKRSWKSDARRSGWVALAVLLVVGIPLAAIGSFLSAGCGTSDVNEFMSPDGQHKLLVYNADCGATTAFSFNVSLLRSSEKLPRGGGKTLYYRYRYFPDASPERRNFDVHWLNANEVQVRIAAIDGAAFTKLKDGVEVEFERLP